jgi:hypothetical protein
MKGSDGEQWLAPAAQVERGYEPAYADEGGDVIRAGGRDDQVV